MLLIDQVWTCITYVLSSLTLSPFTGLDGVEQALLPSPSSSPHYERPRGPIFKPPGGRLKGPDSEFTCDYSAMVGFSNCSTPFNRACWLRNKAGFEYNINTDYEDISQTPIGIHRTYYLNITDNWINADGMNFTEAKLFNGVYPGPYIQACWGDTVSIIVENHLSYNGTSVHWHGIRQWLTMHMDGVNGLTQCPIAPKDSFNYTFKAMQYGSSWYHSHYSVQYADGANGPLTLYGPNSAPYDEGKFPILLTDWGHNSAFAAIQTEQLEYPSILLNGVGNVTRFNNNVKAPLNISDPYTIHFDPPPRHGAAKRYLLRIINTSYDSTFIFSIDNHMLEVVEADFVPIHPYSTESVLIGIGQRYHVIVTAQPQYNGHPTPTDGNFWIRTWKANCFFFNQSQASLHYEQTGILRYGSSQAFPNSTNWNISSYDCSDEPYSKLIPVLPWTVGPPANGPSKAGEDFSIKFAKAPTYYPVARFSLGANRHDSLRVDYENPTFLNLNNTGPWNPLWVVVSENYTSKDWVYMAIEGGTHPIHLHGHDFAILQQIGNKTFPDGINLTTDNPPRRDVVLIPDNGYVVIAFKTDNPGAWLVHCHIAYHAAWGLAMQIMERQADARKIWPSFDASPALQRAQKGCLNWNKWWGDCNNWWPGNGSACGLGSDQSSPDSGI
ncbi:hypothetical protein GP486_001316 [Trichoglossum hirsutum]|uniref:Laccase n=1 Tax=Trichoglossum hirsutum TaxID=265104 RepID=A0A9P8LGW9_9PEZI|nr:hypothetical protein GP486_001316 [Trichoglossum hirsutum]